jgi:S-adenosylmethionine:tRNA ribosyltransferase-isomerase
MNSLHPGHLKINDFDYPLTDDRIAKFPLKNRDDSKLLFLNGDRPEERKFKEIADLLPSNSLLVFNETKVIQARMIFQKKTGANIEIFCLEPVAPSNDFQLAFQLTSSVAWKCFVGNAKRWKNETLEMIIDCHGKEVVLKAEKKHILEEAFLIEFNWEPENLTFSDIIESSGSVPIPPYLNRKTVASDKERYQTIYAKNDGSVAAPTAGLHFTEKILNEIEIKGIGIEKVTLHVGAGTFKPVSSETICNHEMHTEQIVIPLEALKNLYLKLDESIIAVGTTSLRTLESLFWMALKLKSGDDHFDVQQWDPYQECEFKMDAREAIRILIEYAENRNLKYLKGQTQLMIAPGYKFKIISGLITNFHQPKSTLLLLVSALIGDKWKAVYNFALQNDFRFLSYGDSCLFLSESVHPNQTP